ncbi:MAG TPA: hypothetical protein VG733_02965 [Chthoniobacteraceae bacterium]|nr:hypothetical protein [Chthoniobacteraceae bacterium]
MNAEEDIPEVFREHIRRHNREALLLAVITFVAAVVLWTVCFVAIYGIIMLGLSAAQGTEAHFPRGYVAVFAGGALLLFAIALIMRKVRPGHLVVDHKSGFENFLDILLVLPRITFEVWGNLSALVFPTEREMHAAWALLQTMGERRGKIRVQELPLEIPKSLLRSRVVFLLQLAELVVVRNHHDGVWLALNGEEARRLARPMVKIETDPYETAG